MVFYLGLVIDYSSEEKSNYDRETGITTYEEAGKREYGFRQ